MSAKVGVVLQVPRVDVVPRRGGTGRLPAAGRGGACAVHGAEAS